MKSVFSIFPLVALIAPSVGHVADQDVRCVMAGNIFTVAEKVPAKKQLAAAAALYYLGRVDARLSPAQFKAAILAERKSLSQAAVGPTMTACAQAFIARQRSLKALGQELAPQATKK